MRAIGYQVQGGIDTPGALTAFDAPEPELRDHDLLVAVHGVSVNPVDVKVRERFAPQPGGSILGYDAAGVVVAVGPAVTGFAVGDEVMYAGDITRPGSNAERQAVDERLVGRKPRSLDFTTAAGLPLTAITAWELLFDSFRLTEGGHANETLLVIGAAGGVGSMLVQLAKRLTGLRVVATASRPLTVAWVEQLGADAVINHHDSLVDQMVNLGQAPRYVAGLTATDQHFADIVDLIQPRGHIGLIDDPEGLDINRIKPKSLSFSWEFMFARSMFQTDDQHRQHELLNRVADLVDDGHLQATVTKNLGPLSVAALDQAHRAQASGQVIGKQVLGGL